MKRSTTQKGKKDEKNEIKLNYKEQFTYKKDYKADSFAISHGCARDLLDHLEQEIQCQETLKKLPQFNIDHSMNLLYDVNEIAIKTYDEKIDDKYQNQIYDLDKIREPIAAGADKFDLSLVKVHQVVRPQPIKSDTDIFNMQRSESKMSKSSYQSVMRKKNNRKVSQLRLDFQANSFFNPKNPSSPTYSQKAGSDFNARSANVFTKINPIVQENIDLSYLDKRKYNDGLDENKFDKLRKFIAAKEKEAMAYKKLKGRRGFKQKLNITKTNNSIFQSQYDQYQPSFASIQAGHIYEKGNFISARKINFEKLPKTGPQQILGFLDKKIVTFTKPEKYKEQVQEKENEVMSQTSKIASQRQTPPLDPELIQKYTSQSKKRITSLIDRTFLQNSEIQGEKIPITEKLQMNYGVTYKDHHKTKIGGLSYMDSPNIKSKMSKQQLQIKQNFEKQNLQMGPNASLEFTISNDKTLVSQNNQENDLKCNLQINQRRQIKTSGNSFQNIRQLNFRCDRNSEQYPSGEQYSFKLNSQRNQIPRLKFPFLQKQDDQNSQSMPCLEENQHFQSQRQSINYKESKDKIWLNENYDQSQILDENSSIYEKKFTSSMNRSSLQDIEINNFDTNIFHSIHKKELDSSRQYNLKDIVYEGHSNNQIKFKNFRRLDESQGQKRIQNVIKKHRKLQSDQLFNTIVIDQSMEASFKDIMNSTKNSGHIHHEKKSPMNFQMNKKIFQRYFKK